MRPETHRKTHRKTHRTNPGIDTDSPPVNLGATNHEGNAERALGTPDPGR